MAVDQKVLTTYTDQLLDILLSFKHILLSESELLKSTQLDNLPTILEKKATLSNDLEKTHLEFIKILESNGLTLNQLVDSEPYQTLTPELKNKLSLVIENINKCHDLNLTNGMTVSILNNYNQTALNLLTGQETAPPLYSATGTQSCAHQNKNSLGKC